jgi:hypothetical protein
MNQTKIPFIIEPDDIDHHTTITTILEPKKIVLTEDLGKIFEMTICILYGIIFDGKYSYTLQEAEKLLPRIQNLLNLFPYKIKHTAKNGSRYDFTGVDDEMIRLSAKTTKKDGKVCPQVIGQPSKKKFCEYFQIDNLELEQIKIYICENIYKLLHIYSSNTFDCPIIYYNKHKNLLLFIKLKQLINWTEHSIQFSHIIKNKKWGESSTITINKITIGEFQVHNNRDCIKFRWAFEKILNLFKDNFEITYL